MSMRKKNSGNSKSKLLIPAKTQSRRVAVLVLGDIGQSPRMQYHALSLAQAGHFVDFIGYDGAKPMNQVLSSPNIKLRHIRALPRPTSAPRAAFYLYALFKVLYQIVMLLWLFLFVIPTPNYIIVQNPPAIPTLAVARASAFMTGAKLIIDWHNYGYTILAMSLGDGHPIVSVAKCAMAADLRDNWKIGGKIVVLHDKAPKHFRRLTASEMHKESLLTYRKADGTVDMRKKRPMLIVSTTSWTADEDFSVLLKALVLYDTVATQINNSIEDNSNREALPSLAVLITGKGPLRAYYEEEISRLQLCTVRIATAWLSAEDYPLVLGSADLGVSLHTSSSGLDLPMKVVDMLGCGTPVCAYEFPCIGELVTADNGMVFCSAAELAQQIQDLAGQLDSRGSAYQRLLQGAAAFRQIDWNTNYKCVLELLR
ncbi:mannosyltransferase [Coemansia spiralis]|uniref:Chitobiosyldiphosphodolichol beta-mannosyltransferase n=1 Tax=Coemansia spiralis TaxID=417178 RepID=A0A9W8GCG2_9FUNG|nr:mannosyltransferase [Coemansia spiralis]